LSQTKATRLSIPRESLVGAGCIDWLNLGQSLIDFNQAGCYFPISKMRKTFENQLHGCSTCQMSIRLDESSDYENSTRNS
jgi:hypothetical protein